ncbi:hypothetical protein CW304_17720 [Bacillus sp. UFRGS-B20]|nr:hypothetical protein CW304_17720 [Bacillus sp. UFRGS-B20]
MISFVTLKSQHLIMEELFYFNACNNCFVKNDMKPRRTSCFFSKASLRSYGIPCIALRYQLFVKCCLTCQMFVELLQRRLQLV